MKKGEHSPAGLQKNEEKRVQKKKKKLQKVKR